MTQNRFYSSATKRTTTTVDPGTTGTTLTVADTTSFAGLDATTPYTLLINWGQADQEVVNVTARPSATTFTIVRGQDGSSGQAHAIGATVDHGVSARDFTEASAHVGNTAGVHGVTGAVVGTTDAQTLTNKTLTTPTIGSFANAQHNHGAAAGGGLITAPMLSVYRSAAFTLSGIGAAGTAAIPWDGEDYEDNTPANSMHDIAVNQTRLTAPIAGKYLMVFTVELQKNGAGINPFMRLQMRLNGGGAVRWSTGPGLQQNSLSTWANNFWLTTVWKFAAGDYVELWADYDVQTGTTPTTWPLAVGSSTTYATMSFLSA